jgi:hypothetical protein
MKVAKIGLAALLCCSLMFGGCYGLTHVVGDGAKTQKVVSERQWYVLWGLVPINTVDTKAMAKDAKDYTIHSEQSFLDIVIGIFTGCVTIYPRTVTVQL